MTPRKAVSVPSAPQEATQTRRLALESLRDTLTEAIGDVRANAGPEKQAQLAPLAARLMDTLNAIDKLPAAQNSALDELKRRRAARGTGTPVSPKPGRVVAGRAGNDRAGGKRRADPGPVAGNGPPRRASRGA